MNATLLLEHDARIADATDAISQLRRFILDLAVNGKLVARDGVRQSAAIEDCLQILPDGRRIHQGWSPQCEAHPSSADTVWGVLKTTAIQDGHFLQEHNKELPSRFQAKTNLEVRAGDILVTCAGPRARCGVACLVHDVRKRLIISGKMYRFRANEEIISREYLTLVLRSGISQYAINAMKTGSSESGLNLTKDRFRTLKVAFGSLQEQSHIIDKVKTLMGLCDELEAAREEREARRDELTAASLARLNAGAPETLAGDACFALENIGLFTTRADQIQPLRQSILNLAVRGKLVQQAPTDEPAVEFLCKLHDRGRKRSEKNTKSNDIAPIDAPFEAPKGWVWTNVQATLDPNRDISYGVIKLGDEPSSGGIPTLRCSDVRPGFIDLSGVRKVRETIEAEYQRTRLSGGEVVINIRGTLGGVAHVPPSLRGFNVAREVAVIPVAPAMSGQFMVYLMLSPYFWDHIQNNLRGIAYKGLNLGILRELPIPLPPIAEQHRIAAKVGELMILCDQLEVFLTSGEQARSRLLEATLYRALEPA